MNLRRLLAAVGMAGAVGIGLSLAGGRTFLEAQDRGGMRQTFDAASPAVGEPLPDLGAYDADGNAIELRSTLEGHYSVVVFGCLT